MKYVRRIIYGLLLTAAANALPLVWAVKIQGSQRTAEVYVPTMLNYGTLPLLFLLTAAANALPLVWLLYAEWSVSGAGCLVLPLAAEQEI